MLFSLDNTGKIAVDSPFAIYNDLKTLFASLQLPSPKSTQEIKQKDNTSYDIVSEAIANLLLTKSGTTVSLNEYLDIKRASEDMTADEYADYITEVNKKYKDYLNNQWEILKKKQASKNQQDQLYFLSTMKDILNLVNTLENPEADLEKNNLLKAVNRHQTRRVTVEGLKNKVVAGLQMCALDPQNLESAHQPMIMSPMTELIDEVEASIANKKKKTYYNQNAYTKFAIQHENSVGKKNVGIAANGVKAASSIQQYFNSYYTKWNIAEPIDSTYLFKVRNNDANGQAQPLSFYNTNNGEDREICTEFFRTMGDVVLDKDQKIAFEKFKLLYADVAEQYDITTDYKYIDAFVNNITDNQIILPKTDQYYWTNAKGKQIMKREFEYLIQCWQLFNENFRSLGNTLNTPIQDFNDFLEFEFFKRSLAPNVADQLSIFISLSTD